MTLHYIILHCITLHYITPRYITLHVRIRRRWAQGDEGIYITLHHVKLYHSILHCMYARDAVGCERDEGIIITLHYITLH